MFMMTILTKIKKKDDILSDEKQVENSNINTQSPSDNNKVNDKNDVENKNNGSSCVKYKC